MLVQLTPACHVDPARVKGIVSRKVGRRIGGTFREWWAVFVKIHAESEEHLKSFLSAAEAEQFIAECSRRISTAAA